MKKDVKINNAKVTVKTYAQEDGEDLKELSEIWLLSRAVSEKNDGRMPNIPETLTEGLVGYVVDNCHRKIKVKSSNGDKCSWDCYCEDDGSTIQVKAISSTGPTSFGPRTEYDNLILVDFYNNGKVDGSYKIYDASNIDIDSISVNKEETVKDQKTDGKRPRFSLLKIVEEANLKPIVEGDINDLDDLSSKYRSIKLGKK